MTTEIRPTDAKIQENKDTRPTPDPTILTTQQLLREVAWLRELFENRLGAMDKAIALLQNTMDKSPSVAEMYAKHEEKFHSIALQFIERDARTEQTSRDSKVAVDAALQAAKEAVGEQNKSSALAIAKSESATTKQIDQQAVLIATATKALEDKISDLKDRVTANEGRTMGSDNTKKEMGDSWGYLVGGVGMLIALCALIASLVK